jgi:hypothetical protein
MGLQWISAKYSSVTGREKALLTTKLHCGREETGKSQELMSGQRTSYRAGHVPNCGSRSAQGLHFSPGAPPLLTSPNPHSPTRVKASSRAPSLGYSHYGACGNGRQCRWLGQYCHFPAQGSLSWLSLWVSVRAHKVRRVTPGSRQPMARGLSQSVSSARAGQAFLCPDPPYSQKPKKQTITFNHATPVPAKPS